MSTFYNTSGLVQTCLDLYNFSAWKKTHYAVILKNMFQQCVKWTLASWWQHCLKHGRCYINFLSELIIMSISDHRIEQMGIPSIIITVATCWLLVVLCELFVPLWRSCICPSPSTCWFGTKHFSVFSRIHFLVKHWLSLILFYQTELSFSLTTHLVS